LEREVNQSRQEAISESRLRVRYAETDQAGMVYHSNYVIWFEVGRVDMLRRCGFTYKQMEAEGCHLPVVEMRCRFKSPARYDDEITVRTKLKNVRQGLIHFEYDILRCPDGKLLAQGETIHMTVDVDGNRRFFPEKYLTALRTATQER
jgi:acyl-CoA thioester hydrolase